jgi:mono/diheme cytochrome c family protein
MEVIAFLTPFVLLGIGVLFVAFSGGPGRARQAYLTRGNRPFRVILPILYVGLGIAVPAIVIAGREEAAGSEGALASTDLGPQFEEGKQLFRENCASCHTLNEANARGVTGPNLDSLSPLDEERVLNAINIGGTGDKRMPAGILEGEDAEAVAAYVSRVAGQ